MSIVRNYDVPCHYLFNYPVDFKIAQCPMSILRKGPCRVTKCISHVAGLHVACRFTLSNLRVKGHNIQAHERGDGQLPEVTL